MTQYMGSIRNKVAGWLMAVVAVGLSGAALADHPECLYYLAG